MKISRDVELTKRARNLFKTFLLFDNLDQKATDAFPLNNLYNLNHGEELDLRDGFYIIIDGIVLGTRTHCFKAPLKRINKKLAHTQLHSPGDFVGESCLIKPVYQNYSTGQKHDHCLFVLSDEATVWHTHTDGLRAFRENYPQFNFNLLDLLIIKKEGLEEFSTESNLDGVHKILILLRKIGMMYRKNNNSDVVLPKFFTQEVIGQLIGLCRENVNRAFNDPQLDKFIIRHDGGGNISGIRVPRSFLNTPPLI